MRKALVVGAIIALLVGSFGALADYAGPGTYNQFLQLIANTTGLATAANQSSGNGSLATIATNTGAGATASGTPADSAYAGSGSSSIVSALKGIYSQLAALVTNTSGIANAANQSTANSTLSTIAANTTGAATAANQSTANASLGTIAANTSGVATAANQATANSSLSAIATNTAAGATSANQATANSSLSTIATNSGAAATAAGTPADAAWSGTGGSSIVAALKAIYNKLAATLTVSGTVNAASSGVITNPTSTLTMTSATTAYSSGQLIASSATAPSVVVPAFSIVNAGGGAAISRLRLATNDNTAGAWGGQTVQVDLWLAAPTFTNGDRGAFLPATGTANHLGAFNCSMSPVYGDGAYAECALTVGSVAMAKLPSGTAIFWTATAVTGSGATGASKAWTLTAEMAN